MTGGTVSKIHPELQTILESVKGKLAERQELLDALSGLQQALAENIRVIKLLEGILERSVVKA
jgi:hypothetical protein